MISKHDGEGANNDNSLASYCLQWTKNYYKDIMFKFQWFIAQLVNVCKITWAKHNLSRVQICVIGHSKLTYK